MPLPSSFPPLPPQKLPPSLLTSTPFPLMFPLISFDDDDANGDDEDSYDSVDDDANDDEIMMKDD